MKESFKFYVGVDWGNEEHQVSLLDRERNRLEEIRILHSESGFSELAARLVLRASAEEIAVAIETPRGAIVEAFLERGFGVFAISPVQLDRFRDRHSPSGAKDDRLDAFVLADSLVTDPGAFRQVKADAAWVLRMRELSRTAEELAGDCNRLQNRLREQLQRYFPQALALAEMSEPWLWTLLEEVPTPAAAAKLRLATAKTILRRHRIRRLSAEDLIRELRVPGFAVSEGTTEAASEHVTLLIPRLRLAQEQRNTCARRIDLLVEKLTTEEPEPGQISEHRDIKVLISLPGVGRIVTAAMLGEAHAILAARDYSALRTITGVAPVTQQTGKQKSGTRRKPRVLMRRACSRTLRSAIYNWARVSMQVDARTHEIYKALRAKGHSHGRALRTIGDRWLRILVAMLRDGTVYDPSRFVPATS